MGWDGLYPQLDEMTDDAEWIQLTKGMFDDAFVLSILFGILSTEWYLATEEGKLEAPIKNRKKQLDDTSSGIVRSTAKQAR